MSQSYSLSVSRGFVPYRIKQNYLNPHSWKRGDTRDTSLKVWKTRWQLKHLGKPHRVCMLEDLVTSRHLLLSTKYTHACLQPSARLDKRQLMWQVEIYCTLASLLEGFRGSMALFGQSDCIHRGISRGLKLKRQAMEYCWGTYFSCVVVKGNLWRLVWMCGYSYKQTVRHTHVRTHADRQTDRQTDTQTDTQTERQTDRHTRRHARTHAPPPTHTHR